jgi:hypothetical protein
MDNALTLGGNGTQALAIIGHGSHEMVKPLLDADAAKAAIAAYEQLKTAIVQPSDVQRIQGRDFLKKSFWLDLVSESRGFDEGGKLFYSVLYRATAPNGRAMIGDGYCSTAEAGRGGWPEHNVRATAHTRAKNRAISDLVGGGEVSAEEMQDEDERPTPRTQPAPRRVTVLSPTWRTGKPAVSSMAARLIRRI